MFEQFVITRADIEAVVNGDDSWKFDSFWKQLGEVIQTIAKARKDAAPVTVADVEATTVTVGTTS